MTPHYSDSYKFKLWQKNLRRNGIIITHTEELFTKYKPNGDLLFGLFNITANTPEGHRMLPLCFVKGEVVSVMITLTDTQTQKRFLLLVRQRRICDGGLIYEHPAGMVDGNDTPEAVALREVHEETGLVIQPEQLVRLRDSPLFPSSGTSDEAIYFFSVNLELTTQEIQSLHLRHTGEGNEHEFITTHVVAYQEAKTLITNACGLLHIYLHEESEKTAKPSF